MMTYFAKMAQINFMHDKKHTYSTIMNATYIYHVFRLPVGINLNQ